MGSRMYLAGHRGVIMSNQPVLRDFDSVATRWDQEPRRVQLARKVVDAIMSEARPLQAMRVLDFGCGTGLVTLALASLVQEIVAADSSQGMLEQLANKFAASGISNVQPFLLPLDGAGQLPDRFDLVVSSMTMHHIADVAALVKRFNSILKPGGQLCIADLESEDGSFHDDPTGIQHNGFAVSEMEHYFCDAGFRSVRTVPVMDILKTRDGQQHHYPVNMTIGRRED